MKRTIFPEKLRKGDKIAVISPAGAVDESQLAAGLEMLEKKGFKPVFGKHLYTKFRSGYTYAGTEEERAEDLNWALNAPDIAAVWASRGGYGCQHLLKNITLREFHKRPKWYIGYSDNTVIQSYLLKKGYASVHGQTIKTSSFGITEESSEGIFDILKGKKPSYKVAPHLFNKEAKAEGMLVGGNLALIYALLGTPYSFKFEDRILFIEEIGENYYALDRMLMSLDLAGVFRKISGLIIGGMTNMGNEEENPDYEGSFDPMAYEIINHRLKNYTFPVLYGFPNGHIYDNRPLIIGADVKLNVNSSPTVRF